MDIFLSTNLNSSYNNKRFTICVAAQFVAQVRKIQLWAAICIYGKLYHLQYVEM